MKFKKIIFRPNARQMMAVASFQIMSASLFFILYYRASLWAPQAYKYHNEVRCGHDLYAFKDMLQKLDENHQQFFHIGIIYTFKMFFIKF